MREKHTVRKRYRSLKKVERGIEGEEDRLIRNGSSLQP